MRALTLLSSGLDSVVATWAARRDHDIVAALTFDYGQQARVREIDAAGRIADLLGCRHIVVELPWLAALGGSALTEASAEIPSLPADQLDDAEAAVETAQAVWVPNRNGVFVNIAAAYAEVLEVGAIICGFNAEEGATFPDNTPEFMDAADRFFALSTMCRPRLLSPTVTLTKPQIVQLGLELGAPLEHVWSCYRGEEEPCWRCESCQRLKRALSAVGVWERWLAAH